MLLFFSIFAFLSCESNDLINQNTPIPQFSASDSTINVLDTINFKNLSSNVNLSEDDAFTWYFEGGTPSISHEVSPNIVYKDTGVFNVKLVVSSNGMKDSILKESLIYVENSLVHGLIGYYPFNGNANDESGFHQNGVVYGASLTNDRFGHSNSAYTFDGISSYIEISPNQQTINDFTISVWAQSTNWKNQYPWDVQYIFDGHTARNTEEVDFMKPGMFISYTRTYDSTNVLAGCGYKTIENRDYFYFPTQNFSEFSTFFNSWHHLILRREGKFVQLYIDDQLVTRSRGSQKAEEFVLDHPWYVGTAGGNNPFYYNIHYINYVFKGQIDDLRIYNRALTRKEQQKLMRI